MKRGKKNKVRISKGVWIQKAAESTKVCPVCNNAIIRGMFHVAINELHRSNKDVFGRHIDKNDKKLYSKDMVYIHIDCFEAFTKNVKKAIRGMRDNLKQNKLEVVADHI